MRVSATWGRKPCEALVGRSASISAPALRSRAADAPNKPHKRDRRSCAVQGAATAAVGSVQPATSGGAEAHMASAAPSGRKLVFAVDGTQGSEEALRWTVQQLAQKGDTVYLAHVLCDPRTPSTAVGSSSAATQWSPARDEQKFALEFFNRLEHEARGMLSSRFVPALQFSGVHHEVLLPRLKVHKSAAGIGEALCSKALDVGADLVVIASHGAGVQADYGSVARWCSDNSKVPVLLLPPTTTSPSAPPAGPSNALLVAATDNLPGLRKAFHFTLKALARPGDNVYVMHGLQPADEDAAAAGRRALLAAVSEWQAESDSPLAASLNIACDVLPNAAAVPGPEGTSEAAAALCSYADALSTRAVVLLHHGRNVMREMMYGSVTTHTTKNCTRPLLVLDANGTTPQM